MLAPVIVLLSFVAPWTHALIDDIQDCAYYTDKWRYDANATSCENTYSDATCQLLYPKTPGGYPTTGADHGRPLKCYTTAAIWGTTPIPLLVSDAIALCPKTCGFCCKTSAYNCRNKEYPRVNCASMANLCRDPQWRTILSEDCPATCGLCNEGGCVDAVVDCARDPSICNVIGLQDFVNKNCRRTCGRCGTATTRSPGALSCTYIADSSTSCRAWAANGFCTNNFYTPAQRRSYCATTCRIC